jgi:hypothetical protein
VYNFVVINYELRWSKHLQGDLDSLFDLSELDGIYVEELFELLEQSVALREALSSGNFRRVDNPRFDVAPVQWALDDGYNLCYFKMWREDGSLLPVRLIFAVNHAPNAKLCLLGLMPRDEDYEKTSDFGRRLLDDYEHFGVRRIPKRC